MQVGLRSRQHGHSLDADRRRGAVSAARLVLNGVAVQAALCRPYSRSRSSASLEFPLARPLSRICPIRFDLDQCGKPRLTIIKAFGPCANTELPNGDHHRDELPTYFFGGLAARPRRMGSKFRNRAHGDFAGCGSQAVCGLCMTTGL
jgi:hypothetical protein